MHTAEVCSAGSAVLLLQAAKGDEQGQRKWDVLLIQSGQGGGFGFSANWRGFAKDQVSDPPM
jgi:hypothetical protein